MVILLIIFNIVDSRACTYYEITFVNNDCLNVSDPISSAINLDTIFLYLERPLPMLLNTDLVQSALSLIH